MTWAHPHSRGENLYTLAYKRKRAGSSPLTRGKLLHIDGAVTLAGLIPTHAGKTYFISVSPRRAWAHPHSRGENTSPMPRLKFDVGSSPLTRGKHGEDARCEGQAGLIPTHAGKTHIGFPSRSDIGAHPHSRGENVEPGDNALAELGSSPLTRGKLRAEDERPRREGLIPTHAGKTAKTPPWRSGNWAHPHSRGENLSFRRPDATAGGSSPLTRGKHLLPRQRDVLEGLIPTHAGKTRTRDRRAEGTRGSSPLTRGKPRMRHRATPDRGLIPTHAGKTRAAGGEHHSGGAHPHSRGENQPVVQPGRLSRGSSPLTRGKQGRRGRAPHPLGLIPTHAGKTAMSCSMVGSIWAHPHSRGENSSDAMERVNQAGSSPLTRGKPDVSPGW